MCLVEYLGGMIRANYVHDNKRYLFWNDFENEMHSLVHHVDLLQKVLTSLCGSHRFYYRKIKQDIPAV